MKLEIVILVCIFFARLNAVEVIYGYEDDNKNFVNNWDFNKPPSSKDWIVSGATVEKVSQGGYEGGSALKVTQRAGEQSGVGQVMQGPFKPKTSYYMSIFVKQLTDAPAGTYAGARMFAKIGLTAGGKKVLEIAKMKYLRKDDVWMQYGGDFRTPDEDISSIEFCMQISPKEVDFMLDKASLIELPQQDDWKAYLDAKIDKNRRSDVSLKVSGDTAGTTVKVRLVRHEFGFGMAIKGLLFTRDDVYQKFVLDNFNWAVFENDMKWRPMEPTKGDFKVKKVDTTLDILEAHNVTVRGHAVVWDIDSSQPDWVKKLSGETLRKTIFDRIDRYISHFKGRIYCYDVCNEFMHMHWLEDGSGDIDLLAEEFDRVLANDPDTKLFLNDYEVLRNGRLTSAQTNLVRSLRARGHQIDGIGIQGHFRELANPIPVEMMEKRLQIAGSVGVPVHITEFSVHDKSDQVKADALDMLYRVMFAEPNVEAVVAWGFSDQPGYSMCCDMFLTKGKSMTPNAAGQAMLNLITREWNTTKEFTPAADGLAENFRAIRGNYIVTVEKGGQVVKEDEFYVGKGKVTKMSLKV